MGAVDFCHLIIYFAMYNLEMRKFKLDPKKLRKLERTTNPFLSLARSIIYQQISTKAGDAINGRFLKLFGKKKPTPKVLLTFADAQFKTAGLSGQKTKYLRDLATKFLDGTVDPTHFESMSDDEIRAHLIQVKGIGNWTAEMFLIFALNRKNVLPVGDLGIRKGFQKVFNLRKLPEEKKMVLLARPYIGNHTNLSLFLWQSLE